MGNSDNTKKKKKVKSWEVVTTLFIGYDILTVLLSFFLALWVRFDCQISKIPSDFIHAYHISIGIHLIFTIAVYVIFKLYNSFWKFAGYYEFVRMVAATVITCITNFLTTILVYEIFIDDTSRMPISYFIFGSTFQFAFAIGLRFSYRTIQLLRKRNHMDASYKTVVIFGAGDAGRMLLKDINNTPGSKESVIAFFDDNAEMWNRRIDGIPVVGGRDDVLATVEKYDVKRIYVALPSIPRAELRDILNVCTEAKCEVKNLPGFFQLRSGQVSVSAMKEVAIEDLLGREPIKVNDEEIGRFLEGKVVLITGAGGSIGSELSRQVAANNPKTLVLFDVYENGVYDVQLELRKKYPYLDLQVLIGSVRDSRRIFQVFDEFHPNIVYHAAAHKHVPLMEVSPCEAIKNNTIGTYKTAFAAMVHGCERFVLISTDKAVNPTNVMGASKRMCEMIIQTFDAKIKAGEADKIPQLFTHWTDEDKTEEEITEIIRNCKTEFVAVRFGNVLGSNGSVIPIFKRQIAAGGPVTVTHPDIIRYFMTIPEAVSLVLQAGTYAHGGEIFVLDMGEPMKIDTLARNLIKLSGFTPDVDIRVEYTGLRPGEKLYEEKLMDEEGMQKTDNDLIHIGSPIPFDHDDFLNNLDELMEEAYKNKKDIRKLVGKVVDTYHQV